jgi:selenocysteine lyase/cysteine desulfurase
VTLVDGQWSPERTYLNTASFGLPPTVAFDELRVALDDWRAGRVSWERWCESTERARACFAHVNGVAFEDVAVGATTSELVGLIAASVPDGSSVLAVDGDFASLLFPWTSQSHRRVTVTAVPLDQLAARIDTRTDVVVVSVVQSATGAVADLDAIVAAAKAVDAVTVVDATQSCGWLPLDASKFDAVVCSGYKWLLAPRGTAYAYVGERLRERMVPLHANWYAGEDRFNSYYGLPARLATGARQFDTSPAWFSWVGAAPAIELLETIGIDRIHEHNVRLANRFRAGLGLVSANSAIVSAEVEGADERLRRSGIQAATRAGALRVSFHVYNTDDDVDITLEALTL